LDVEISADLIEEVARIVGYEKIPATLMKDELPPQRRNRDLEIEERIRDILAGCGLTEVITYSLTNLKSVAKLQEVQPNEYLKVANPLKEREYLRKTLLVGLLETVSYNQRHSDRIAIFEIGRVYLSLLSKRPKEPRRLGIALWGIRPFSWLEEKEEEMGFFDLKGVVEALADQLGLEFEFKAKISKHPSFHPGRLSEVLLAEEPIGILGEAHPKVAESFDIKGRVCMAELDLDQIIAKARAEEFSLSPIPRFPAVVEDIAVVVDEAVPASKVQEVILKAGGGLLKETVLFDLYVGKQVPKGKKSLTYSLVYQAEDRTLTDEEVHQIRQSIQKQLKEELDAVLRGLEEGGGNA
jgi:phenylalanyl-tRNA synthetase beta chain